EWVTVTDDLFRSPLGTPFTGDVDLALPANEHGVAGRLVIEDLTLLPFTSVPRLPPPAAPAGDPPPLPVGIPATGVIWTARGDLALGHAHRVLAGECMVRAGWEHPLPDLDGAVV